MLRVDAYDEPHSPNLPILGNGLVPFGPFEAPYYHSH